VDWDSVFFGEGGWWFGVRQIKEFHYALLGKLCGKMFVDRAGLWFRVLGSRYGVKGSRWREGWVCLVEGDGIGS